LFTYEGWNYDTVPTGAAASSTDVKTVYENLQPFYLKCSLSKGKKDDTDFRQSVQADIEPDCRFCPDNLKRLHRKAEDHDKLWMVEDKYPVSIGHHLIIPKRHIPDWFSMTEIERRNADASTPNTNYHR